MSWQRLTHATGRPPPAGSYKSRCLKGHCWPAHSCIRGCSILAVALVTCRAAKRASDAVGFEAARLAASNTTRTQPLILPPQVLRSDEAQRRRILRKANSLLQDRLVAARMMWPLLRQAVLEYLGNEADPLTIATLAEKYRVEAGESDPINLQSRVLRPSYPTLHLAIGLERLLAIGVGRHPLPSGKEVLLALLSKAEFPGGVAKLMSYEFLLNPTFTLGLLELSEVVASLVALAPRLRGAQRQLIRFVADAR